MHLPFSKRFAEPPSQSNLTDADMSHADELSTSDTVALVLNAIACKSFPYIYICIAKVLHRLGCASDMQACYWQLSTNNLMTCILTSKREIVNCMVKVKRFIAHVWILWRNSMQRKMVLSNYEHMCTSVVVGSLHAGRSEMNLQDLHFLRHSPQTIVLWFKLFQVFV